MPLSNHPWLIPHLLHPRAPRTPTPGQPVHLLLCIADHFEPQCGRPPQSQQSQRLQSWLKEYPALCKNFRDSDGTPPQHTFFFPIDEYVDSHVDAVASLCRQGLGETEIHLHHDGDTAATLRKKLLSFTTLFRQRHGLLPQHKITGALRYGFVHGNWALNNSRPDGKWCGVNNEIAVLLETGCYADFTMPSAPSPTQTRIINSLYYAKGHDHHPKAHDTGIDVGTSPNPPPPDTLMLIQGPLLLNWHRRKFGILPRVENACIQGNQPPTLQRLDLWLKVGIQVPSRPDWFFVKLHTHGAVESNQPALLGRPAMDFHQALADRAAGDKNFHYHYVTARQMYNLAKAAEAGYTGPVSGARDFELIWNP